MIKNMKSYNKNPIQGRLLHMYIAECKCDKKIVIKPSKTYTKMRFVPDTPDKYVSIIRRYEGRCSFCGTYWHKDWIIREEQL